jgi:hypothetical protein
MPLLPQSRAGGPDSVLPSWPEGRGDGWALAARRGRLQGVVIAAVNRHSRKACETFIRKVRGLGFAVKLDAMEQSRCLAGCSPPSRSRGAGREGAARQLRSPGTGRDPPNTIPRSISTVRVGHRPRIRTTWLPSLVSRTDLLEIHVSWAAAMGDSALRAEQDLDPAVLSSSRQTTRSLPRSERDRGTGISCLVR